MAFRPPLKPSTAALCDALIGAIVVSNCRCSLGMNVPELALALPGAATADSYTHTYSTACKACVRTLKHEYIERQ